MECKICGVKMAKNWSNGICIHCDWHLDDGYTVKEIKEMIKNKEVKNND